MIKKLMIMCSFSQNHPQSSPYKNNFSILTSCQSNKFKQINLQQVGFQCPRYLWVSPPQVPFIGPTTFAQRTQVGAKDTLIPLCLLALLCLLVSSGLLAPSCPSHLVKLWLPLSSPSPLQQRKGMSMQEQCFNIPTSS